MKRRSTDVYVKVKNASAGTSLRFTKGNAILTPLNSGSGMLNAGESAVYKTDAGPVSHYSFKMNGVNDVSFPAGLVTFEPGMIYTFVFDGASLSWDGNPVPVSVQTCYEEKVDANLDAPRGLTAKAVSANEVSLAWNAVSRAQYYYSYSAADENGPWAGVAGVTGTSYNHTGLIPGRTYYYKVRAFRNGALSADYSAVASALPSGPGLFIINGDKSESVTGVSEPFGISNALTWLKTNAQANTAYTIIIYADETLAPQILDGANLNNKTGVSITLKGCRSGRTVRLSSPGTMFTTGSGITLVLDGNITLTGRTDNDSSLIKVDSGGTLRMEQDSEITGNTNNKTGAYWGGGVFAGGTVIMNDGEISENTARLGGGVYIHGTFTMNSGEISENTAGYHGGGVYVSGTFIMNGGKISENTVSSSTCIPCGGGVLYVHVTFTMSGGTISDNTLSFGSGKHGQGGGVCVFGTFVMSGSARVVAKDGGALSATGDTRNSVCLDGDYPWIAIISGAGSFTGGATVDLGYSSAVTEWDNRTVLKKWNGTDTGAFGGTGDDSAPASRFTLNRFVKSGDWTNGFETDCPAISGKHIDATGVLAAN